MDVIRGTRKEMNSPAGINPPANDKSSAVVLSRSQPGLREFSSEASSYNNSSEEKIEHPCQYLVGADRGRSTMMASLVSLSEGLCGMILSLLTGRFWWSTGLEETYILARCDAQGHIILLPQFSPGSWHEYKSVEALLFAHEIASAAFLKEHEGKIHDYPHDGKQTVEDVPEVITWVFPGTE